MEPALSKTNQQRHASVTINIQPGKVTPHMRALWKSWWAARIAEVKRDLESQPEAEAHPVSKAEDQQQNLEAKQSQQ